MIKNYLIPCNIFVLKNNCHVKITPKPFGIFISSLKHFVKPCAQMFSHIRYFKIENSVYKTSYFMLKHHITTGEMKRRSKLSRKKIDFKPLEFSRQDLQNEKAFSTAKCTKTDLNSIKKVYCIRKMINVSFQWKNKLNKGRIVSLLFIDIKYEMECSWDNASLWWYLHKLVVEYFEFSFIKIITRHFTSSCLDFC